MRQNAHFETTTTCKTSKIVVEGKEKHVLCNEYRETQRTRLERITMHSAFIASSKAIFLLIDSHKKTLPPNTLKIIISDKMIQNAQLKTNTLLVQKKFEDNC